MLFQFTKVTTASPHTTQEYQPCHGFLWVFAKPPAGHFRPRRSGPNYYLPSPRRASFFTSAAGHTPPAAAIYSPFLSRLRLLSASTAAFSIQEHLTIRNWLCQHIIKINRITVYPFIYKRVNHYNTTEKSLLKFILLNHSQHKMNVGPENVPVRHSFCVCPELLLATNIWRSYLQSPTAICDHFAP